MSGRHQRSAVGVGVGVVGVVELWRAEGLGCD